MSVQLDLFETNDETSLLRQEIKEVRERLEAARRGLFARHTDLHRMYIEQQKEIDYLKEFIHGKFSISREKEEPLFDLQRTG
jgi:hypothetical protein